MNHNKNTSRRSNKNISINCTNNTNNNLKNKKLPQINFTNMEKFHYINKQQNLNKLYFSIKEILNPNKNSFLDNNSRITDKNKINNNMNININNSNSYRVKIKVSITIHYQITSN